MQNHEPAGQASGTPGTVVHLVRVNLQPDSEVCAECLPLLSPQESQRMARLVTADLQRRFAVCRAVLRRVLATELSLAPSDVQLVTGPHGKPALQEADRYGALEFNVSHTRETALIAWCRGRALGVDIESRDRTIQRDELAQRFFSTEERRGYFGVPAALREASFYRIWTCKEAWLKAIGAGLSFPLGKFTVSADPTRPPQLLDVEGQPDEVRRWVFLAPDVGPNVAAALAVAGHGWTLSNSEWDHRAGAGINIERE